MFCRCPTTERHTETPRKRKAKSERNEGAARLHERQMDRK